MIIRSTGQGDELSASDDRKLSAHSDGPLSVDRGPSGSALVHRCWCQALMSDINGRLTVTDMGVEAPSKPHLSRLLRLAHGSINRGTFAASPGCPNSVDDESRKSSQETDRPYPQAQPQQWRPATTQRAGAGPDRSGRKPETLQPPSIFLGVRHVLPQPHTR